MSFSTLTPLAKYDADGLETTFTIPDKYYDDIDIHVFLIDEAGAETELTQGDDFTVITTSTDPTPPSRKNGNVELAEAPADGLVVVVAIWPKSDQDQTFEGRPVTPRQNERVHDRHAMRDAFVRELLFRSFRAPLNELPALRFISIGDEGTIPIFDDSGNLIEGPTLAEVSAVSEIIDDVIAVSNIAANVTAVANNIANVNAVAADLLGDDNIGTVSAAIASVIVVSGNLSGSNTIGIVAADLSGDDTVGTVAAAIANVNLTGNNIGAVNTVAADLAGSDTVGTVAADLAGANDIGTVVTNIVAIQNAAANAATASAAAVTALAAQRSFAGYNPQSGSNYDAVASDAGKLIGMSDASANSVTIRNQATVTWETNAVVMVGQADAGQTSLVAGSGVTFISAGGLTDIAAEGGIVTAMRIATDTWWLSGALA